MMDTSQIVEKLKNSLKKEIAEKFTKAILVESRYIPINIHNNALYVAIVDTSDKQRLSKILTDVKSKVGVNPVAINITNSQFEELLLAIEHMLEEEPVSLIEEEPIQMFSEPELIQDHSDEPIVDQVAEVDTTSNLHVSSHVSKPVTGEKKRLGDMLVDEGLITKEQLIEALAEGKRTGEPIGSVLVKAGFITLMQLREVLNEQQGFDAVDTSKYKISPAVVNLLPEDFIRDNKIIPISTDGKILIVGMVNPNNKAALNDIIYLTGLKPQPQILTHIEFENCIDALYESKKETDAFLSEIELDVDVTEDSTKSQLERELQDDSSAIGKFVNQIIVNAIVKGASDLHIEPRANNYIVRYRTDGILKEVLEIPSKIEAAVVSRIKVIARMNIAEHRRPQDGVFSVPVGDLFYDLRVNTLPVGGKEKIVIRVLKPTLQAAENDKELKINGGKPADIAKINTMITSPHGVILVSGPTGSGKTTTLYSVLNNINDEIINITTIEDPVEIKLPGINQVQVNTKADVTFASCMRAILRQDPDVIMIGEIRDEETLEIAIKAALTGHLVLSTIHTNSAVESITRMIDMGAKDYLVASALQGIIAQRLVRRICPHCKEAYKITDDELSKILTNPEVYPQFKEKEIFRAKGCNKCDFNGYAGRIGIYEVLPMSRELKRMIATSSSIIDIEEAAVSGGMTTLNQACIEHILDGNTTVTEYIRVLGIVNG